MSIGFNDFLIRSNSLGNLGVLQDGSLGLSNLRLCFVECFTLHLPLGFQGSNNVLVLPANLEKKEMIRMNIKDLN